MYRKKLMRVALAGIMTATVITSSVPVKYSFICIFSFIFVKSSLKTNKIGHYFSLLN